MPQKFTTQRNTYIDPATGETKRVPKITGKLISLNKDNPEALYNLGTFSLQNKNYELGIEILTKALKLKETKETYLNLATCYKLMNRQDKARKLLYECMEKWPNFPLVYNNLGLMLYDIRDIPTAIKFYRKALELNSNYGDAKWNLSLALNLKYFTDLEFAAEDPSKAPPIDDFQTAMTLFESRFEKTSPVSLATHHGEKWKGQALKEGERLWILCEQGVGDIIQFIRYGYFFKPEQVVFHIPMDMHFMVKKPYTCTNTTEGSTDKYWIPMMDLAKYFPIEGKPYISVPEAKVPDSVANTDEFKIGIVWKGNPDHANDINRSRNVKDFQWLKEYGKIFSLQKDAKVSGLSWLTQLKLSHWAYTIGAINGLDIVVCVDTSVAHMCGAMGKPCIVLIPAIGIDWRWGELGENCIWYDSVRFARMQSMDEVRRLLEEFKANGNKWGPRKYIIKPEEFSASELQKLMGVKTEQPELEMA